MNCEYGAWPVTKPPAPKEVSCGRPGTAQQVAAQSGDTFKFRSDGRRAPVVAVLCSEHAAKLQEQGCEIEPLANAAGA